MNLVDLADVRMDVLFADSCTSNMPGDWNARVRLRVGPGSNILGNGTKVKLCRGGLSRGTAMRQR